ncbi:ATP-binding protein [Erwinia sp.]|uniref:ATP-binding protein n=1 Tax=Erwinia citreus TaxID=558 RepID=UPI003C7475A2
MKRFSFILIFALLLLPAVFSVASQHAPFTELKLLGRTQINLNDVDLSQAEWSWLRKKRELRFGASSPNFPPFDITSGINDYGGISADYLAMIARYLNINVSVRYYPSYQIMLDALAEGEIDLIANAGGTEKHRYHLLLSQPYVASIPVLIKRDGSLETAPRGEEKIAIDTLFAGNPAILKQFPRAHFVSDNSPRRTLEGISFGQLDGYIVDSTMVKYLINQANLNNLQINPLLNIQPEGFAFATTSENQQLTDIINKILSQIPDNVRVDILRRWSGGIPLSLSDKTLQLTPLEQKWIAAHPRVRVAVVQDYAPLSFFDKSGHYRGLTADLLSAISARTGLNFEVKNIGTLRDVLGMTQQGETDVVAGVTLDNIWANGLLTTRTYLFNSWVMVGRKNSHAGLHKIALQAGDELEKRSEKQYPGVIILPVESHLEGLNLVMEGKADGMVLPLISADFLLPRYYANSLQIISSLNNDPARFALGVSPENYPLVAILDKAMLNIQPEDLHALTSNWYSNIQMGDEGVPAHTYTSFLLRNDLLSAGIIGICMAAAMLFFYRHRRQQRLITELTLAREQADSASRAKTIFLATMSHEIRTPLSAIIGLLELVLRRHKIDTADWRSLQQSYDSAQSLLALIGDILDIARIESDRLVLHPQRADIRQLIESTAIMFEGLAREKGLEYRLEIDAEIQGDLLIDPLRVKQILSNLLNNAVKFTGSGEIILRAEHEPTDHPRMGLRIQVQDSGCGISAEIIHRLFQPFSQVSSSQGGSGLGLYICRSLTDMMGGKIELQSQPENGTTVTLHLSALRLAPLTAQDVPALCAAESRNCLSVLIAEDHPAGRHLLEQQLIFLGHRTHSASEGEQALQILAEQHVDLVITDCNMPRLNGYQFTRQLRARERSTGATPLPIWGLTATAQPGVRECCLEAGMNDCLFKPIDLNLLAEKLQSLHRHGDIPDDIGNDFCLEDLPAELRTPDTQRIFLTLLAESLNEELERLDSWQMTSGAALEDFQALMHRILGGIRIIGASELCQVCHAMEQCIKRPSDDEIRRLRLRLQTLLTAIHTRTDELNKRDYT